MAGFTFGAISDKGDVRTENQDSILCVSGDIQGMPAALFLVADGMGGLSYGGQVSRYIKERFLKWWQEDLPSMIRAGWTKEEDMKELLEQEIWDINQTILHFKKEKQCRAGSTLSVLLLYGKQYYVENLGDSRVYRMHEGMIRQITEDQSLVAQMIREKRMTREEAYHFAKKNVLTMCIGMFDVPQIFSTQGNIEQGDIFLVCSDGFYNVAGEDDIRDVMSQEPLSLQEKTMRLRQLVPDGKALDNVSIIVAG